MLPTSSHSNHNHLSRRRSCLKIFIPLLLILFGWSWLDTWYYGARYARGCHPDDLWSIYFTSSDYVAIQRWLYGEPDIIEVRQIFQTSNEAKEWESKVIKRMNAVKDERWLNKKDPKGKFYNLGHGFSEETKKRWSELRKRKTGS